MKSSKRIEDKYYEIFRSYDKGYISKDEVLLYIFYGEGKITKKEFDNWTYALRKDKEMLGHPVLIKFNKKYDSLLKHYRNGDCTIQDVLDAIEVLERFKEQ